MPTYEYQCKECGHRFEEFQSITAEPLLMCPSCGKPALKRLLGGGGGMVFKGSGFYLTDYKKGASADTPSKKPATETKATPPPPSTPKSETSSPE